jgi:plasmid stabilization system protein ParE
MRVVYTPTAARQIESQIAFLVGQNADQAAVAARERMGFIGDFLTRHPRTGRFIPKKQIYEIWIPRTRYVVFYRVDNHDTLRILALFHTPQDRSDFAAAD